MEFWFQVRSKRHAEARVSLSLERASGQREPLFERRYEQLRKRKSYPWTHTAAFESVLLRFTCTPNRPFQLLALRCDVATGKSTIVEKKEKEKKKKGQEFYSFYSHKIKFHKRSWQTREYTRLNGQRARQEGTKSNDVVPNKANEQNKTLSVTGVESSRENENKTIRSHFINRWTTRVLARSR